jgi:hypothetical protein
MGGQSVVIRAEMGGKVRMLLVGPDQQLKKGRNLEICFIVFSVSGYKSPRSFMRRLAWEFEKSIVRIEQ